MYDNMAFMQEKHILLPHFPLAMTVNHKVY